jgi:ornithine cyclodeaminase/alanine dehydrogenase-like protein (mu-crystallin family)
MTGSVLILTRADIQRVMTTADWLDAAETAFRAAASGTALSPPPLHIPVPRGGFHAKGASIALDGTFVAVKVNGNFPGNPAELGLPTVQGAIILADGRNGALLAILDSIEVTLRRTAAASALAARLLARPDSATLLICGCGEQGRAHAEALREVLPISRTLLWDRDRDAAERLARELDATAVDELAAAAFNADVIACCTSAREPFLDRGMVGPGTFIAAVGADNPDKNEIEPALMAAATVVTDSASQCAAFGDLHHAIDEGVMSAGDVHAGLADVLAGAKRGRRSNDEIIIYDSTGTGLLDVAASAVIFERCLAADSGLAVRLAEYP